MKNILIKNYFIIFLGLITVNILHLFYLYIFTINRDLGYIQGLMVSIMISLFIGFIIILLYLIFFNFIYKIKLENKNLYFLILFISSFFIIIWEISYTRIFGNNCFTYFVFNYDFLALFIFYIIGIGLYGYYLKKFKKK